MDALLRFSGGGHCPKCTVAPCNAKFCEKDCTRGPESEKDAQSPGGQFTSEHPPMASDLPAHLHRICRGCGYEWLEQTADAVPEGAERGCGFCLRTKTECGASVPSVPFLEGANSGICGDCITALGATLQQMLASVGPQAPAGKGSATAH